MTSMLDCAHIRPRLEELLHGELPPEELAAFERHIDTCEDCRAALGEAEALQIALLSMPVPELRPGFAAEALAAARRRYVSLADTHSAGAAKAAELPSRRRLRPDSWWGAVAGAMAAGILLAVLWALPGGVPEPDGSGLTQPHFRLALYEPREIAIAIDADQPMPGSRLTVRVDGGIELVGFGEIRELSWEADLEPGTNVLSLPVLAHSLEQGRLTTVVEHETRRQQIELTLQGEGTPPAADP